MFFTPTTLVSLIFSMHTANECVLLVWGHWPGLFAFVNWLECCLSKPLIPCSYPNILGIKACLGLRFFFHRWSSGWETYVSPRAGSISSIVLLGQREGMLSTEDGVGRRGTAETVSHLRPPASTQGRFFGFSPIFYFSLGVGERWEGAVSPVLLNPIFTHQCYMWDPGGVVGVPSLASFPACDGWASRWEAAQRIRAMKGTFSFPQGGCRPPSFSVPLFASSLFWGWGGFLFLSHFQDLPLCFYLHIFLRKKIIL